MMINNRTCGRSHQSRQRYSRCCPWCAARLQVTRTPPTPVGAVPVSPQLQLLSPEEAPASASDSQPRPWKVLACSNTPRSQKVSWKGFESQIKSIFNFALEAFSAQANFLRPWRPKFQEAKTQVRGVPLLIPFNLEKDTNSERRTRIIRTTFRTSAGVKELQFSSSFQPFRGKYLYKMLAIICYHLSFISCPTPLN